MKENVTAYDALEISKEWLEQPMFNKVVITLNTENTLDSLDLSDNDFLELIIKKKSAEKLFGSSNEALQSLLNKIRNQVEVKECND